MLPGFAGTLGLRMGLLRHASQFNIGAGAFLGLESINFVLNFSPGLRLEVMGQHGPVLIPYLSLSLFSQLLVPFDAKPVGVRTGVALSWNLAAIPGAPSWFGGLGGTNSWAVIPIAIVGALIAFGDVRLYLQTDPRGLLIYGLSIGLGF
ncbi:MAG: hypothetical protein QM817_07670 [Archangium sp.]